METQSVHRFRMSSATLGSWDKYRQDHSPRKGRGNRIDLYIGQDNRGMIESSPRGTRASHGPDSPRGYWVGLKVYIGG